MPLLALALQIWQDAMAGVQAAWAAYGQPVLAGAAAAVQNLCAILLGVLVAHYSRFCKT